MVASLLIIYSEILLQKKKESTLLRTLYSVIFLALFAIFTNHHVTSVTFPEDNNQKSGAKQENK